MISTCSLPASVRFIGGLDEIRVCWELGHVRQGLMQVGQEYSFWSTGRMATIPSKQALMWSCRASLCNFLYQVQNWMPRVWVKHDLRCFEAMTQCATLRHRARPWEKETLPGTRVQDDKVDAWAANLSLSDSQNISIGEIVMNGFSSFWTSPFLRQDHSRSTRRVWVKELGSLLSCGTGRIRNVSWSIIATLPSRVQSSFKPVESVPFEFRVWVKFYQATWSLDVSVK